jgi:hypothetical protein
MSDLGQELTAAVRSLSSVAHDLLNKALTYFPAQTLANIYCFMVGTIIAAISAVVYFAWPYTTRPTKQKKPPDPITTMHAAIIDAEQITPQNQVDKLNSEDRDRFAARY